MKNIWNFILVFLLSNVLFFAKPILANSEPFSNLIELYSSQDFYNATPRLSYIEDKENNIKLDDVINFSLEEKFQPYDKDIVNLGFTKSTYWFKFKVKYVTKNEHVFLEIPWPHLDYIDVYLIGPDILLAYKSGRMYPYYERDIKNKNFIFKIPYAAEPFTVFLRIKSDETIIFPVNIHDESHFHQKDRKEEFIYGIYYGIIIVMFFYNLFIYLSLRDKNYFLYLFYVACLGFFQLSINGIIFQIWPDYPQWNKNFLPLSQLALEFVLLLFFQHLLGISQKDKYDFWIVHTLLVMIVTSLVGLFIFEYNEIIQVLNFLGLVYMIASIALTFKRVLRGSRTALFFLLTWFTFLSGGIVLALRNFGMLPANFFTNYSLQIGSTMEMVLLSLALADKINTMKKELTFLNLNLEDKVDERTRALTDVLHELKKKNEVIESELELAADIQKCIMPKSELHFQYIDILVFCEYLTKVGGDYYDVFPMQHNRLGILIADVSGHGIPAALLTTMAKISFMNCLARAENPVEVFREVDKDIAKIITTQNYLTAFLLVLCPDGKILYSSAGHRPPFLMRKGSNEIEILKTDGFFLGIMQKEDYYFSQKELVIQPGDRIILYTDGIIDACNSIEDRWGEENLMLACQESRHLPPKEALDYVIDKWRSFMNGLPIIDDSTLLIVDFKGESN